jgi:dihydrofolate reductase
MNSPYTGNPQKFLDKFSMIFATSINGMIGKDNKLLWHLPNDLKRFKELTKNKIVIMGRKTFDSLPNGALPGRLNIVMCNDDNEFLEKSEEISTPNTAVAKLSNIQSVFNFVHNFEMNPSMKNIETDEVFVIGGGVIYNLFLPYVQKIYMTFVDVEIDGDTKMPDINKFDWEELEAIDNEKDEKHKYDYTFLTLKKINQNEK